MPVFESVRKALMVGLGVQESIGELVDELVKKGELSESQGSKLVKEWTDKAGRSGENLGKSITDLISSTLEKMNIPTREEVDRLNRKVQALSAKIKKLEESASKEESSS